MKVLVYAKATTIAKLQVLLGKKGYIEVDQLTLPEGFMIPKLFGQHHMQVVRRKTGLTNSGVARPPPQPQVQAHHSSQQ